MLLLLWIIIWYILLIYGWSNNPENEWKKLEGVGRQVYKHVHMGYLRVRVTFSCMLTFPVRSERGEL